MAAKYKKRADGRYLIQVQIGVQDNGKAKYKNIYAHTVRELEEKAAVFRQELEKGVVIDDRGLTVEKWANKWLEVYKSGVEHNTYEMYRYVIKNHIIPELGHYKLKDLKSHHVQELINKKAAKGLTKTLVNIKLTLGQILDQAIENEYIYKNACSSVSLPSIEKKKKRSLTEDEKALVINAPLDLRSKALVYIFLYTGLRRGEALALSRSDIDLKNRTISVSKTLIFKGGKGEIKLTPKTDAGNRVIPVPDVLLDVLREYLSTSESYYVFPTVSNEIMSESSFRRLWEKILRVLNTAAGGYNGKPGRKPKDTSKMKLKVIAIAEDITPHIFRHTYATSLYYAGVDMKAAQYLLGHSSVELTLDIYTHLQAENDSIVVDKLNTFFSSQSNISQNSKMG